MTHPLLPYSFTWILMPALLCFLQPFLLPSHTEILGFGAHTQTKELPFPEWESTPLVCSVPHKAVTLYRLISYCPIFREAGLRSGPVTAKYGSDLWLRCLFSSNQSRLETREWMIWNLSFYLPYAWTIDDALITHLVGGISWSTAYFREREKKKVKKKKDPDFGLKEL